MVLSFCYNLAHEVGSNAVPMYPGYLSVAEWLGSVIEAVHARVLNFPSSSRTSVDLFLILSSKLSFAIRLSL